MLLSLSLSLLPLLSLSPPPLYLSSPSETTESGQPSTNREEGLPRAQVCRHLELGLPASGMVRIVRV